MESSQNECGQLVSHFSALQQFKADPEEHKLIEHFFSKYRDGKFPKELPQLIEVLQKIICTDSSQLQFKPLQLLRFCTKQR